ncbi:hypothetical protein An11g02790 [Aspergillus niger]|uniref:Uncharacterized protein n=2 Tax=Aspergillus niger TaxID=5061 RepID=A2QVV7_ASPNC|nr:hypothetical protein An11g02790 [Aspergillus niger]CAK96909.1 hypothetical protein An11g02790 [Aspergillus niger]
MSEINQRKKEKSKNSPFLATNTSQTQAMHIATQTTRLAFPYNNMN